ncbi:cobalt ECF transporter T component CbiQ [Fusibacter ferrireducens]|uniref:Cobalt ECF transporter T component CbiQ n=1 Tax=Fusibacter ferrireducens TaxID=2785058 RepID=A0ABR9ZST2_9FIRM|nr:cobalt ECF transporter T component CbiQ [Fusibacter ferrireducens]MBF4693411.1 cobalt ECF transporter T component CbiQ [Fusibacter ferrireducens]
MKRIKHNHGEGVRIDYYAYASHIKHWNATFKVFFSLVIMVICIAFNNPYVSTVVIVAMAYITIVKGQLPLSEYLRVLAIPTTFILLSVVAIIFDFSKEPMGLYHFPVGLGYFYTSKAMLKTGLYLTLKVFAAISALQMMTLSTPFSEIISVMRKAHVPKLVIELMNMIYRYIFILLEVSTKMKNAADSRLGNCDFKTSCSTFGSIGANLLVISMRKANAYYDAMESRCYDGDFLFYEEDRAVDKNLIMKAALFIVILIIIGCYTRL